MKSQNDLITKYLLDTEDDLTVFEKQSIERPQGELRLALGIRPSFGKDTRIFLLESNQKYFVIGQYISSGIFRRVHGYIDIVRNYKSDQDVFLDIDHPAYSIEWQFEIEYKVFNDILNLFTEIRVSNKTGLDGTTRRVYLKGNRVVEWWEGGEPYHTLTYLTDTIINFSLKEYGNAYPVNPR